MKKLAIITDDNSGLTKQEAAELGNVFVVPMPVILDGETYYLGENITTDEFWDALAKGKDNKTSQPEPGKLLAIWEDALAEYEHIIHMPMSGGLSNAINTAKLLAQDYNGRVIVVDNRRISVTLKQAIYDALRLLEMGKDVHEIAQLLEENRKNSAIYIYVDTLKFLKKGGRISAASAAIGSTLHIKPILCCKEENFQVVAKAMGAKKGKQAIIDCVKKELEKYPSLDDIEVSMGYSYDLDQANDFKNAFEAQTGIKVKWVDHLSLSVCNHVGPGAVGLTVSKIVK